LTYWCRARFSQVLLGSAGPSGTATKAAKAARVRQPGVWELASSTECLAGGVECAALVFVRRAE